MEELGLEAAACAARLPELRAMAEVRNTIGVVDLFHTFPIAQLIQPPSTLHPPRSGGMGDPQIPFSGLMFSGSLIRLSYLPDHTMFCFVL